MLRRDAILGADGLYGWSQERTTPVVYLDTCGMRTLANDPALSERFINALGSTVGTWAVSMHNVVEFRSAVNRRHVGGVADLIDRASRHLFFIEFNHEVVITAEKYMVNANKTWAADGDVFHLTTVRNFCETGGGVPIGDVWRAMQIENGPAIPFMDALSERIRQKMGATLQWLDGVKDRAKQQKVQNLRAHILRAIRDKADRPRATDALRQAAGYLLSNYSKNEPNDALDMGHAIVTTAYCDLVVLDKKWRTILEQASKIVRKSGSQAPLARLFRPTLDGLRQLVTALESYERQPAATAAPGANRERPDNARP